MLTAKQADERYNASPIKWSNTYDELKELLDEVKKVNIEGIKDELGDVFYFATCALYYSTSINLPIILSKQSVIKIEYRFDQWKRIFSQNDLKFDKKYLVNGANYNKIHKVEAALNLAKLEQK